MRNKIKILYTIPNFNTAGSGKVVYDLVKGLDKEKFAPEICCSHSEGAFFKEVQKLNVPIHIFNSTTELKPYISFPIRLMKIIFFFRKHNFDLIHSWHWSSDITEPIAAKLSGIKWVYTKKAMSWGSPKKWQLRSKLSSKIFVLNKDMLPKYFKKLEDKVELVYLGVDPNKYMPQKKIYTTPLGHEFSKKDFVIVTVANLVPIKGIEYLIKAVNKINDVSIKLLIVGNSKNEYGQALLAENKNSNIIFIDKQLDVRPYHAVSDVFVIPTKTSWEGLPVAPLEAMSSERIVIGSNVEGVREVLFNFKNCMFPPKDSQKIKEKIEWIRAMNKEEKEILQHRMRQEIEEKFSLAVCISRHTQIYFETINI
jgi:glycosyltransferase involved in cell wall biosynthesis